MPFKECSSLDDLLQNIIEYNNKTFTEQYSVRFVLRHESYNENSIRIEILERIRLLSHNYTPVVYLMLNAVSPSVDLQLNENEIIDGFSPLQSGDGYVLTDKTNIARVLRLYQQDISKVVLNSQWLSSINVDFTPQVSQIIYQPNYLYKTKGEHSFVVPERCPVIHQQEIRTEEALVLQVNTQLQVNSDVQQSIHQNVRQDTMHQHTSRVSFDHKTLSDFCEKLKIVANDLRYFSKRLNETYSQYTLRHLYFNKIKSDENFRRSIAARLFGLAYLWDKSKDDFVFLHLPQSIDGIDPDFHYKITRIFFNHDDMFPFYLDGFNQDKASYEKINLIGDYICGVSASFVSSTLKTFSSFSSYFNSPGASALNEVITPENGIIGSMLVNIPYEDASPYATTSDDPYTHMHYKDSENTPYRERLSFSWRSRIRDIDPQLRYLAILDESKLDLWSNDLLQKENLKRNVLILISKLIIEDDSNVSNTSSELLDLFENTLVQWVSIYSPQHLDIFERFLTRFVHKNPDHYQILLIVIIKYHAEGFEWFLTWLRFLENRCLLDNFFHIYFTYAKQLTTLSDMMLTHRNISVMQNGLPPRVESQEDVFFQVACQTKEVSSQDKWSCEEKFAHHLLLFFAQQQPFVSLYKVRAKDIADCWLKVRTMMLQVSASEEDADVLMQQWVDAICRTDGFNLEPLHYHKTFFDVIPLIFENALKYQTMSEQVTEMGSLSLLWGDVTNALKQGFRVVSHDMDLRLENIDPTTRSYIVSKEMLIDAIKNPTYAPNELKRMIFRYLGMQTLREPLSFYRELLIAKDEDLNVIMLAYLVLDNTGSDYKYSIDEVSFARNIKRLVNKYHKEKALYVEDSCTLFLTKLQSVISARFDGKATLQSICLDATEALPQLSLPTIFIERFNADKIISFVLYNQKKLLEVNWHKLSSFKLKRLYAKMIDSLRLSSSERRSIGEPLYNLIHIFNLQFDINHLIEIASSLTNLSIVYRAFISIGFTENSIERFSLFARKCESISEFNTWISLILQALLRIPQRSSRHNTHAMNFLDKIQLSTSKPKLNAASQTGLEIILDYDLTHQHENDSIFFIKVLETLSTEDTEFVRQVLQNICQCIDRHNVRDFFHKYSDELSAKSYAQIAILFHQYNLPVEWISRYLERTFIEECFEISSNEQPGDSTDGLVELYESDNGDSVWRDSGVTEAFEETVWKDTGQSLNYQESINNLFNIFEGISSAKARALSTITSNTNPSLLINHLQQLNILNEEKLLSMAKWVSKGELSLEDYTSLFENPTVPLYEKIDSWNRSRIKPGFTPYVVEETDLNNKISALFYVSPDNGELIAPNFAWAEKMRRSVHLFVEYTNSAKIWETATNSESKVTLYELDDRDLAPAYFKLKATLNDGILSSEDQEKHEIMLLALACHVHERTINQRLRLPQILCLLNTIFHKTNLFHQVETSGGKSTLAAIHAVLFHAKQQSVDISTENESLAETARLKFQCFYQALGIFCAKTIIEADTNRQIYLEHGIHYTTVPQMNLFEINMKLKLQTLPTNRSAIFDEGDDAACSPMYHNLANVSDVTRNNEKHFLLFYRYLLDFVREPELFINNGCNEQDTLYNFKEYVLSTQLDNTFIKFLNSILEKPDAINYIRDAVRADRFKEGVDYLTVEKTRGRDRFFYAAPIIEESGTKRPDPRASFEGDVHPILHIKCNEQASLKYPYEVMLKAETIATTIAKKCFDKYRLNGGYVIALSATLIEHHEFYACFGLRTFRYPSFHPAHNKSPTLIFCTNKSEQNTKLLEVLPNNPNNPCIIFCDSPKDVLQRFEFLKSTLPKEAIVQYFLGYDQPGSCETNIVEMAGKPGVYTIATQSLSRGTHIQTETLGLIVINLCTKLSKTELPQMYGRTLRDGQDGEMYSIINTEELPCQTGNNAADFEEAQNQITLSRQKARERTRLLHDVRHYVIHAYFLDFRCQVNRILNEQYGFNEVLVDDTIFHNTLRDFNQETELKYEGLIQNNEILSKEKQSIFLNWVIDSQKAIIRSWITNERNIKFGAIKVIEPRVEWEPLITLSRFHTMTIGQSLHLSDPLAKLWKAYGHQAVHKLDNNYIEHFKPCFDDKRLFKTSIANCLIQNNHVNIEEVLQFIEKVKTKDLDSARKFFEQIKAPYEKVRADYWLLCLPELKMPGESVIYGIENYCDVTKTQVINEAWNDLTLPPYLDWIISVITTVLSIYDKFMTLGMGTIKLVLWAILPNSPETKLFFDNIDNFMEILPSIIQLLRFVVNIKDTFLTTPIRKYIDVLLPISKNQLILKYIKEFSNNIARKRFDESIDLSSAIETIPDIIEKLNEFQDITLESMLTFDAGYALLEKVLEIESVKKLILRPELQHFIKSYQKIDRNFVMSFKDCPLKDLYFLLKALAHPAFCEYLEQLPKDTTFETMLPWLQNPDFAPDAIKEPLKKLDDYQVNHESRQNENASKLKSARRKYTLTERDLNSHLNGLYYHPIRPIFETSATSEITLESTVELPTNTQPSEIEELNRSALRTTSTSLIQNTNLLYFKPNNDMFENDNHRTKIQYPACALFITAGIATVVLVNIFCFSIIALALSLSLLALACCVLAFNVDIIKEPAGKYEFM